MVGGTGGAGSGLSVEQECRLVVDEAIDRLNND
jgi:hypothetical protein